MAAMRQEKQEAVDQAELAIQGVVKAEPDLKIADYRSLLARFVALWHYARGCQIVLEIGYYFKNAYISHYDPEAKQCEEHLGKLEQSLRDMVSEARGDARLRGLEEDVYRLGLNERFLTVAEKFSDELAKEIKSRSGRAAPQS